MSSSKSNKDSRQKAVDPHAPVHTSSMSPAKRMLILAVSIFCLLIFSVTGPMTQVFSSWISGGPAIRGTVELPSGSHDIDQAEFVRAANMMDWEERLLGRRTLPDDDTESVLAYATLMDLADEMEVAVTDGQVIAQLGPFQQAGKDSYRNFYRSYGFPSAAAFENQLRQLLRVQGVIALLSTAAVPTDEEAFSQWQQDYEEFQAAFTVFYPANYVTQAAALEPSEEELQSLYDEGLTPLQRADLEIEQAVAFEIVELTPSSLETEAVKAWFQPGEVTQEALDGFYSSNKFTLYRRPDPEDGQKPDPELGMFFTQEELGDRLERDYLLNKAINELAFDLPQAEDAAAFAAERGARFEAYPDLVPMSELADLEGIGSISLRRLFQGEDGTWMPNPVQLEDRAFLMRPTSRRDRALPPLEDIREELLAIWREGKQAELAKEAAQAFIDALPRPEGALEGDPAVLDAEAFRAAVAASGQALEQMDWISRQPRPAVDPIWPTDATVLRGLRSKIGQELSDRLDGEVIGPEDFGADGIAVAQILGRRLPSVDSMWPLERQRARLLTQRTARQRFLADAISFEGLARAYGLKKVGE